MVTAMNKRLLKILYLLFHNGNNIRSVKKILKQKYNILLTINDILTLKTKHNILKLDKREKYTKSEISLILRMYKFFYDNEKICTYLNNKFNFNITIKSIVVLAHKRKVKKIMLKRMFVGKTTFLQQKKIANDYVNNIMSTKELAIEYNYARQESIIKIVKKFNLPIRTSIETKEISKSYYGFSLNKIDSNLKGYFLGLLVTDGWISNNRVFLDLTDKDVMEFLSKSINVNLTSRKRKNCKRSYRFSITYKNILEDVSRYGLIKNKTYILPPPQFFEDELKYLPMFFRGVIDGDGWISKNGKEFFISSASKNFIWYCKQTLESVFEMDNLNIKNNNNFFILRSHKQKNIEILKNKIYCFDFGMKRKYNRLYGLSDEDSESII